MPLEHKTQTFNAVATYEDLSSGGGSPVWSNYPFSYRSVLETRPVIRPKPKSFMPPTAYYRHQLHVRRALAINCSYEQRRLGLQLPLRRTLIGDVPTVQPVLGNLSVPSTQQDLLNAALRGMVDSKFNLLTSIAEFRKTAEHLASTATRLRESVVDVKRGRFIRAAQRLGIVKPKGVSRSKSWASNWLEYKYGWMPLVNDAYGVCEHLATLMRDEAPIFMSRKRARVTGVVRTEGSNRVGTFEYHYAVQTAMEAQRQVCVYYQVDYSSLLNLKRLGLLDPGATLWETVPFSFVVDWFLPVGEWLSLVNSWQGLLFKGACHTTLERARTTVKFSHSRCTSSTEAKLYDHGEQVHPGFFEGYTMKRNVIYDPYYRIRVKSPVSLDHAITSIALLRQQFR